MTSTVWAVRHVVGVNRSVAVLSVASVPGLVTVTVTLSEGSVASRTRYGCESTASVVRSATVRGLGVTTRPRVSLSRMMTTA